MASYVSIHAPTQGATFLILFITFCCKSFNPRAHAGRDTAAPSTFSMRSVFQSTRPRRARRVAVRMICSMNLFQSTRPRRARQYKAQIMYYHDNVSIHAPTQGATLVKLRSAIAVNVSIHAPTQGATFGVGICRECNRRFNPRAHAGRDSGAGGIK